MAVAAEVAIAVVVLISAGLLVRSLQQLIATSPGFRADHLLTARIALPNSKYNTAQTIAAFHQQLLAKLQALPGVESAGEINQTPLVPNTGVTRFLVEGAPPRRPGDYPVANFRQVTPDYFKTMRIPLLNGRVLEDRDMAGTTQVIGDQSNSGRAVFSGTRCCRTKASDGRCDRNPGYQLPALLRMCAISQSIRLLPRKYISPASRASRRWLSARRRIQQVWRRRFATRCLL